MKQIQIDCSYITLGQLLKMLDLIGSGGEAKYFLQETAVKVNREAEDRRGRKIYPGDQVLIEGYGLIEVSAVEGGTTNAS